MACRIRTTEQFKEDVHKKHGNKVEIMSEYIGQTKPINILYHCDKHGYIYKTINAKNIFGKSFQPCKQCDLESKSKSGKSRSMNKDYQYNRLKTYCEEMGGKLISTKWTTARDVYEVHCSNPEHPNFFSSDDSIMNKTQWCPYCCGRKGDFNTKYKNIIESKNGIMLSEYIDGHTHIRVKCNKDNYEWDIYPSNIQKGRWCPVCNLPFSEKVPYDYLMNNQYKFEIQYSFKDLIGDTNELLKFDFALFHKNKLVGLLEIDDEEHRHNHTQLRRVKARERDELKNKYCEEKGIPLYRMYYHTKWAKEKGYQWYYDYINKDLANFLTMIYNINIA